MCLVVDANLSQGWCSALSLEDILEKFLESNTRYVCFLVRKTGGDARRAALTQRLIPIEPGADDGRCLPIEVMQCLVARANLFLSLDSSLLALSDSCNVRTVHVSGRPCTMAWQSLGAPFRTLTADNRATVGTSVPSALDALG